MGCAKSLGAIVKAFDTREAVREQVESLGGQFITFAFGEKGEGEGGYAKQMSDAYLAAEQEFIAGHAKDADIVITTALIPGKPAPQLLTSGAVVSMRTGSVVVDLAAEQGGNCALTERDRVVVRYGVTIIGWTDLTSRLSRQASELYSANIVNLLEDVMKDGVFTLDLNDEVQRAMLVLKEGELMWPPAAGRGPRGGAPTAGRHRSGCRRREGPPLAVGARGWAFSPPPVVLVRARAVRAGGAHPAPHRVPARVCRRVPRGLERDAGAAHAADVGHQRDQRDHRDRRHAADGRAHHRAWETALAAIAVLVSSINIAGGFLVTHRMLKMFRR